MGSTKFGEASSIRVQGNVLTFRDFYLSDNLSFFLFKVKVQTWVDGMESSEFVGVGARFGKAIVSKEKNANQTRLTLADPRDCCSAPKNKVFQLDYVF